MTEGLSAGRKGRRKNEEGREITGLKNIKKRGRGRYREGRRGQ